MGTFSLSTSAGRYGDILHLPSTSRPQKSLAWGKWRMSPLPISDAADLRAQPLQLLLDAFVAPVDVIDALDVGGALRHKPRQDEACRGPQIGRHHRRGREARHAPDDRGVALEPD